MTLQEFTTQLSDGRSLDAAEVEHAVAALTATEVADEAKADFLKALRAKGETAKEIAAFVQALLARAVDPGLEPANLSGPMIDVCGTGGDKLELFNVSTAVMFVLAGGGASVVKHGNRAITSKCGGADVLEELGVKIDLAPADLRRCVETNGLGFIFAPRVSPGIQGHRARSQDARRARHPDDLQSPRSAAQSRAPALSTRRHLLARAPAEVCRSPRAARTRARLGGAWQRHG